MDQYYNKAIVKDFIDQSIDAMALINKHGEIIEWNPAQETLTGISKKEAIRSKIWEIQFSLTHDKRNDLNADKYKKVFYELSTKDSFQKSFIIKICRKNGSIRHVVQNIFTVGEGSTKLIGCINHDVTEIKEYESSLHFLHEASFKLLTFNTTTDIYHYTIKVLYEIIGKKGLITLVEFDHDSKQWFMKAIEGLSNNVKKISSIVGYNIMEMNGNIHSKYFDEIKLGKLTQLRDGISDLTEGKVPSHLETIIKKLIGLNEIYCISYRQNETLFGTITFLLNKKSKTLNQSLIESFVSIFSAHLEKFKIESELKQSESKYRTLFEKSSDPILFIENEKFILVNEATVTYLGYSDRSEIEGKTPWELSPVYQEDGKLSKTKAAEMIKIAFDKGVNRFEWIHARKDGKMLFVDVSLTYIPVMNQVHTVWRDITDKKNAEIGLKESEEKFRRLVNDMSEGLMQTDLKDEILFVNPKICQMLGYSEDELIGKIGYETIVAEGFYETIKAKNFSRKLKNSDRYSIRMRKKNGDLIWVQITGSPIVDKNGETIGTIGLISDITELKQTQEELAQHHNKLEELVKLRTIELEAKNAELERFNNLFVGREFRIKELKDKIKVLENKLGSGK